jgi:hypothetical protein
VADSERSAHEFRRPCAIRKPGSFTVSRPRRPWQSSRPSLLICVRETRNCLSPKPLARGACVLHVFFQVGTTLVASKRKYNRPTLVGGWAGLRPGVLRGRPGPWTMRWWENIDLPRCPSQPGCPGDGPRTEDSRAWTISRVRVTSAAGTG